MRWFALLIALIAVSTVPVSASPGQPLEIGRGQVLSAAWSPDGARLLVNTVGGAWLYDDRLNDVARLPLWNAAYSPDGALIAGIDAQRRPIVLDAGTLAARLAPDVSGVFTVLAWSPDSRRLAVVNSEPWRTIVIWEIDSYEQPERYHGLPLELASLHWNPAGTRIAGLSRNGLIAYVWTTTEYGSELSWALLTGVDGSSAAGLIWLDDDRFLAGERAEDYTFTIYDAATGLPLHQGAAAASYTPPALSPDGKTLYLPQYDGGRFAPVAALPLSSGQPQDGVRQVVQREPDLTWQSTAAGIWSPDGSQSAHAVQNYSETHGLRSFVWRVDAASGRILQAIDMANDIIEMLAWHPDGARILAVGRSGRLTVLGPAARPERPLARWLPRVTDDAHAQVPRFAAVAWAPDGPSLAVGDGIGALALWDVDSREQVAALTMPADRPGALTPFDLIAWHPDGRYIAASAHDYDDVPQPTAYIFDRTGEGPPFPVSGLSSSSFNPVEALAWHPSGDRLAIVSGRNPWVTLHAFPWQGEQVSRIRVDLPCECAQVMDVMWNRDGSRLMLSYFASRSNVSSATAVWDEAQQRVVGTAPFQWVLPRRWLPDGRIAGFVTETLVSPGSPDATTAVYDPDDGTLETAALPQPAPATQRAFASPDGLRAARFDSGGSGLVYDLARGRLVAMLDAVYSIAWSPDGRRSAVLLDDGSLWVGDRDVRVASILRGPQPVPVGAFNRVVGQINLYWSADGARLAVAFGGVVTVYDAG